MDYWQRDAIAQSERDLRDADLAALGRDRNLALAAITAAMRRIEHELTTLPSVADLRRAIALMRRAADAADGNDWGAAHLDIVDARRSLASIRW
jgi:hypothetical protein